MPYPLNPEDADLAEAVSFAMTRILALTFPEAGVATGETMELALLAEEDVVVTLVKSVEVGLLEVEMLTVIALDDGLPKRVLDRTLDKELDLEAALTDDETTVATDAVLPKARVLEDKTIDVEVALIFESSA